MYLETMAKVLPKVKSTYVIDKGQQAPLSLLNITSQSGLPATQPK